MTKPVATKTNTSQRFGLDARRRRALLWVVGVAASAVAGHRLGAPAGPVSLVDLLGVPDTEHSEYGVLVLHPEDCPSAWRFLDLLARPAVLSRVPVVAIVATAGAEDPNWREAMPRVLRKVPVLELSRGAAAALAPLGLQGIPTLLIFRDGQLVGLERSPATAMEFVALGRRLDPQLGKPRLSDVPNNHGS